MWWRQHPALGLAAERLPLTFREREIVTLIGAGFSSRAVAARLQLSVRTIEGHIYRAMAKTGAASREELAALLPRPTAARWSAGRYAAGRDTSAALNVGDNFE
jgi:DNA-binding CsgD family transcriptional regulator